jgi:hypothetical protein
VLGSRRPQSVPREPTKGNPADTLTLLSFPRTGTSLVSLTPFGGKVEMALRMAGLEFEGRSGNIMDPKHAPKQKARRRCQRASRHASGRPCQYAGATFAA